jgi:hypothetical protein
MRRILPLPPRTLGPTPRRAVASELARVAGASIAAVKKQVVVTMDRPPAEVRGCSHRFGRSLPPQSKKANSRWLWVSQRARADEFRTSVADALDSNEGRRGALRIASL